MKQKAQNSLITLIILLCPLSCIALPSLYSAKIPIKSRVIISNADFDAACLLNFNAPPTLVEQFSKIPLGSISNPLGELDMPKKILSELLGSASQKVEIPSHVTFRRIGDILQGKLIANKIYSECLKSAEEKGYKHIEMDLSRIPSHMVLPAPLVAWELRPTSTNVLGMRLFAIEIECKNGKRIHQILQVDVWELFSAAKVTRLLKRGQVISNNDIQREEVKIKSPIAQSLISFDEAVGRKLALYKSPGTFLRETDLKAVSKENNPDFNISTRNPIFENENLKANLPEQIVKTGETVEYSVQTGGLRLTVPARALEPGGVGDFIRLINLQNQRCISGKIIGEGKVAYVQK